MEDRTVLGMVVVNGEWEGRRERGFLLLYSSFDGLTMYTIRGFCWWIWLGEIAALLIGRSVS